MAVQNREFPAVVDFNDFDPEKVSPGQIVIVNILGMHAVYIGTRAGKATRMAEYNEEKDFLEKTQQAAQEAEKSRANAAVLYELMQRMEKRMTQMLEKAGKTLQDVDEAGKKADIQISRSAEKALSRMDKAAEMAEECAMRAESAQKSVDGAVTNLGDTVRASLAAIAIGGGGK